MRDPDGAVSLIARPAGGGDAELVGEYVAQLIEANPGAGPWLAGRLDESDRRSVDGTALVPVGELIDGLATIAAHGRPAGATT